jgi:hypothetical protein
MEEHSRSHGRHIGYIRIPTYPQDKYRNLCSTERECALAGETLFSYKRAVSYFFIMRFKVEALYLVKSKKR